MRIIIANTTVTYSGRLTSKMLLAKRMLCLKEDGSISIHCDSKAYKPLNWMNPPCEIEITEDFLKCKNAKGEELYIEFEKIIFDSEFKLGDETGGEPGLEKDGVEAELQKLINDRIHLLGNNFEVIKKEYYTAIGPVDFLCKDENDNFVAVEIKRIGEISGVDQVIRYVDQLKKSLPSLPTGMLVATKIKPQAIEYAKSNNIRTLEIPMDKLYEERDAKLKLF
jgi:RecB family endonuclease NucS